MAVAGELDVEGVEELIIVQAQDLTLERGTPLRGERIETTQVELGSVPYARPFAKGSGDNPVIVAAVRTILEEHGAGGDALATYMFFGVMHSGDTPEMSGRHCRDGNGWLLQWQPFN